MNELDKSEIISEINSTLEKEDIGSAISYFNKFLDLLIDLTEQLHNLKIELEPWQEYLEEYLFSYTLLCNSHLHLAKGTYIQKKNYSIIDLNSNYLIARAEIENYYTFYYLFIQPENKSEYLFRYLLFKASGLKARQKFTTRSPESQDKQMQEKKRMEELKEEIKKNEYFRSFTSKKQKYLLKNLPAKTDNWVNLIKSADIKPNYFLDIWRLYSNYAHSEALSFLQFSDYMKDIKARKKSNFHTLFKSLILTSVYIKDFLSLFSNLEKYYQDNINDKLKLELDFLNVLAKNYNP